MTWVRLDDGFAEHPLVWDMDGAGSTLHLYLLGLCHAARYRTDGVIAVRWAEALVPGGAKELAAVGRWHNAKAAASCTSEACRRAPEPRPDQLLIHDFLAWNMSREEDTAMRAQRALAGARGGKAKATRQASAQASAKHPAVGAPSNSPSNSSSKHLADLDLEVGTTVLQSDAPSQGGSRGGNGDERESEPLFHPGGLHGLAEDAGLSGIQTHLLGKIARSYPAFMALTAPQLRGMRERHGARLLTEALQRVVDRIESRRGGAPITAPVAYLERALTEMEAGR